MKTRSRKQVGRGRMPRGGANPNAGALQVFRGLGCPSGSRGQVGTSHCVNCWGSVTSNGVGVELAPNDVGNLLRALFVYEEDAGVADCRLFVCDACNKSKFLDSFLDELYRLETLRVEFNKRRKIVGEHVLMGSLGRSNKDFIQWEAEVALISDVLPIGATRKVKRTKDVAVGPDIKMEKADIPMNPQDIKVEIKQEEIEIPQETFDPFISDGLEPVERTLDVDEPLTNQSDAVDILGSPETNGESRLGNQQQKTDILEKVEKAGAVDEARKTSKSPNEPSPAQRSLQPQPRLTRRRKQKTFQTTKATSVKGTDEGEVTTNNVPSDSSLAVERPRLTRKGRSSEVEEQSDEADDKNVDGFLPSDRGADSTASVHEAIYNPGDQRSKNVVKCSGETYVLNAHCRSEIDGYSAPCGGRPRRAIRKRVRYGESQNEEDSEFEEVGGTGQPETSATCQPLTMSGYVKQPKKSTGGSYYQPRCKFCPKVCKGCFSLRRHCYLDHKEDYLKDLPFACRVCYHVFSSAMTRKVHQKKHESQKCHFCGKFFLSKRNFIQHIRTHTGEKPYACDVCHLKFAYSCALKGHMKTHTGEKPYACYFCDRKFSRESHLKNHLRTHTGEKPFVCDVCDRKFSREHILKEHKNTHTGEKPHVCSCGEYFRHRSVMNRHKRTTGHS